MLIYTQNGKLACLSKRALEIAGYMSPSEFLQEHEDYSELFVKKPGYIYNFENFSWITFLKSADAPKKKVLIRKKDETLYECDLSLEVLYPLPEMERDSQFYYQIYFKNLRPVGDEAQERENPFEEPQTEPDVFASAATETTAEPETTIRFGETEHEAVTPDIVTKESTPSEGKWEENAALFDEEADHNEPKEVLFFDSFDDVEESTPPSEETTEFASDLSWEDTILPEEKKEEEHAPLEMMDFTFDEEPSSPSQKIETAPFASEDEKEAVADVWSKEAESQTKEEEAPSFIDFESQNAVEESEPAALETKETTKEAEEILTSTPAVSVEEESEKELATPLNPPNVRRTAGALGLPETLVKNFLTEMVQEYEASKSVREAAMEKGDLNTLRKEAFKFKGIAANLLMDDLSEALDALTEADLDEMRKGWAHIDRSMEAVGAYLSKTPPAVETKKAAPTLSSEGEAQKAAAKPTLELTESGEEAIDFDPEEAAEALGLPASLIVEFANDFVQQAHEEKQTFIQAYESGDLTKINETAHKLKGVAANLRIEEMRALMEKIQHAESLDVAAENLQAFYKKLGALRQTMKREYA